LAIVQISRITQRKGLQENLPQLAGAEFGWSIDERRLFIGNGTLEEGAPVIGNTEILTEFSDILQFQTTYTYKGQAAGYTVQTGPTAGNPVVQSLQSWLDQFATVKDFGAVGDGVTDDTDAINRALYQLFCRETNPQIRRSLFFPAGVYRVTETILIPTYATVWGEGLDNSIIQLDDSGDDSTLNAYVARTADSLQQYGVNIGNNGATAPGYVTLTNIGFRNLDTTTNVFLVEDANNCTFKNVGFFGPLTKASLTTEGDFTKGIAFASTASLVCDQIIFDTCKFSGTVYGVDTDQQIKGVTFTNSNFDTLYKGVILGTNTPVNGGPTGVRITNCLFDNIYAEGVVFGDVSLNATGYNIFYDVGNHFLGTTNPYTAVIDIQTNNNLSVGDMFQRADVYAQTETPSTSFPRITLNNTQSIATTNGVLTQQGTYSRASGISITLADNSSGTAVTINGDEVRAFIIEYTIIRDVTYRTGKIMVSTLADDSSAPLTTSDEYVENATTGVSLTVNQVTNNVTLNWTTTSTGSIATLSYSITSLV
jgi:hypothetical protein